MTYDRLSTYLTWGGDIGGTGEDHWQVGVHLAQTPSLDGPGLPDVTELGTLLAGPLTTFHAAASSWLSAGVTLGWAKAASIDAVGHYTTEPVYVTQTPVPGGSTGTLRGGPQVSACITLWSGQGLGQANYGRFYVPWWEAQVETSGHVQTGPRDNMAENAASLVQDINAWAITALSASTRIMIMSKLGTGASKRAKYVKVGDVKDTQQRRRRQLAEQYDVITLTGV